MRKYDACPLVQTSVRRGKVRIDRTEDRCSTPRQHALQGTRGTEDAPLGYFYATTIREAGWDGGSLVADADTPELPLVPLLDESAPCVESVLLPRYRGVDEVQVDVLCVAIV